MPDSEYTFPTDTGLTFGVTYDSTDEATDIVIDSQAYQMGWVIYDSNMPADGVGISISNVSTDYYISTINVSFKQEESSSAWPITRTNTRGPWMGTLPKAWVVDAQGKRIKGTLNVDCTFVDRITGSRKDPTVVINVNP
jgi:hypothetical protein